MATSRSDEFKVGRVQVPLATALKWLAGYLNQELNETAKKPFAYPAYDHYEPGAVDANEISDGDLLAPMLLNVKVSVRSLYALQAVRSKMEAALEKVKPETELAHARDDEVRALVGPLYAVLDPEMSRPSGVKATTLSKIYHRKRPKFALLHDRWVRACYVGSGAPVRDDPDRTWAEYMISLSLEVRNDLVANADVLGDLREHPGIGDRVSDLRILDILAWSSRGGARIR